MGGGDEAPELHVDSGMECAGKGPRVGLGENLAGITYLPPTTNDTYHKNRHFRFVRLLYRFLGAGQEFLLGENEKVENESIWGA